MDLLDVLRVYPSFLKIIRNCNVDLVFESVFRGRVLERRELENTLDVRWSHHELVVSNVWVLCLGAAENCHVALDDFLSCF